MKQLLKSITVSDSYIVRQPLLPKSVLFDLADDQQYKKVKDLMGSKKIREAIYIASPSLIDEWDRRKDTKEQDLLLPKLFKYITRIAYRCTPFGLSAGVTSQTFNQETNKKLSRRTRLDSQINYLLFEYMFSCDEISSKLKYVKNSSLYFTKGYYRYMKSNGDSKETNWTLRKIKESENLNLCIDLSKDGISTNELAVKLEDKGYDFEDAQSFIQSLLESQVLVAKLQPYLIGPPYFYTLLEYLSDYHKEHHFTQVLKNIKDILVTLDSNEDNLVENYKKILKQLKVYIDLKDIRNPFHVELFNNAEVIKIPKNEKQNLKNSIKVLAHFQEEQSSTNRIFKTKFVKTYLEKPVPLVDVLDAELGIGFPVDSLSNRHWYITDLDLSTKTNEQPNDTNLAIDELIKMKLITAEDSYEVNITKDEIKTLNVKFPIFTPSFYCLTERLIINQNVYYYIPYVSGFTAAAFISRFSGHDTDIDNLISQIAKIDSVGKNIKHSPFEIEYLADNKLGNISSHKAILSKKTTYLSGSLQDKQKTISFENIHIKYNNGILVLTDGFEGNRIMPYLYNAHNYYKSLIPMYHFLANFLSFNYISSLSFNWNQLLGTRVFFPRVCYQNIILSKASWHFSKTHFKGFEDYTKSNKLKSLKTLISKWNISQYVCLKLRDKSIFLDLFSTPYLVLFLEEIKNKDTIHLEESLEIPYSKNSKASEMLFLFNSHE